MKRMRWNAQSLARCQRCRRSRVGLTSPMERSICGCCQLTDFACARRRSEFADPALTAYFLTWQVLSALSQSLEHSLRRMSQDSAVLPRAMHCAF
jgi:hypothetical protein